MTSRFDFGVTREEQAAAEDVARGIYAALSRDPRLRSVEFADRDSLWVTATDGSRLRVAVMPLGEEDK